MSRHGKDLKRLSITSRQCNYCCADDRDTLSNLMEITFFKPIIEDESSWMRFVFSICSLYEDLREDLSNITRTTYRPNMALKDELMTRDIRKFLIIWSRLTRGDFSPTEHLDSILVILIKKQWTYTFAFSLSLRYFTGFETVRPNPLFLNRFLGLI